MTMQDALSIVYLPILTWGALYSGKAFTNERIVALIVTEPAAPRAVA